MIYNKRSLACHPDRQPSECKNEATRAQTLLNLAKGELIDSEEAAARYLQTGVPTEAHNCAEFQQAAQLVDKFSDDTPDSTMGDEPSPPCTPKKERKLAPSNPLRWHATSIRSRDRNSPPNTPRIGSVGINEWVTRIRIGLIFTVLFLYCKSVLIDG